MGMREESMVEQEERRKTRKGKVKRQKEKE
jgi:hypothetical protein